MNRQYIGARYVVKVYENSQDSSSAEWEQGTFEPLVMVTWHNSSYISKKQVPGNIGNPANNPNYWACTGYYNGQILELQNDITELYEKINNEYVTPEYYGAVGDGTTDDRQAIQNAIDSGKHVLFVDKSYRISSALVIKSNTWLTGQGTTILCDDGFVTTDKTNMVLDAIVENFTVLGSETGVCIDLEVPIHSDASIVDTNFNNLRIRYFEYGIKSQYSWTDNFYRVRIINCTQAFALLSQSNDMNFYGCHFNADTNKSRLTNSTGVNFNGCSFENTVGLTLSASGAILCGCYVETINDPVFIRVGTTNTPEQSNNLLIVGCKTTLYGNATPYIVRNDSYGGNSIVTVLSSDNIAVSSGYALPNQNNVRAKGEPIFATSAHNIYKSGATVGECTYKMVNNKLFVKKGNTGDTNFTVNIPVGTPIRIDCLGYGEGTDAMTIMLFNSNAQEVARIRIPEGFHNNKMFYSTNELILEDTVTTLQVVGVGSETSNYLGYLVVSEMKDNSETIANITSGTIVTNAVPTFTAVEGTLAYSITANKMYCYTSNNWVQI